MYRFQGSYGVNGFVNNSIFIPLSYSQKWITKKKKRDLQITFKKNKVSLLIQQPIENEFPRININLLRNYSDPLTSFLKLLSGVLESKTIDGRRIYVLSLVEDKKDQNKKTYEIKDYINIWADHKRNDLKEISIINKSNNYLPEVIYIKFKDRLFRLLKY